MMMERDLFKLLLQTRRLNKELSADDQWGLQDSDLESYLASFQQLITQEEILRLVDEKKGPIIVLDLMGSGKAWETIESAKILAVSLSDKDTEPSARRYTIGGDVLSKTTWKRIHEWLKINKCSGFDIITCRPEGGIHTIPDEKALFAYLLKNLVEILNRNGGILLSQLPGSYSNETNATSSNELIAEIKMEFGVDAKYQSGETFGLPSKISAIRISR